MRGMKKQPRFRCAQCSYGHDGRRIKLHSLHSGHEGRKLYARRGERRDQVLRPARNGRPCL